MAARPIERGPGEILCNGEAFPGPIRAGCGLAGPSREHRGSRPFEPGLPDAAVDRECASNETALGEGSVAFVCFGVAVLVADLLTQGGDASSAVGPVVFHATITVTGEINAKESLTDKTTATKVRSCTRAATHGNRPRWDRTPGSGPRRHPTTRWRSSSEPRPGAITGRATTRRAPSPRATERWTWARSPPT
jgi:hypothetical protein